jgi:DNA-binding transcriptional LysR family regulator
MRLRHIEVIGTIANSRSMREAAAILGVSQPALSQTLHHAESLLGYKLFSRDRRRLVPTPELLALLPYIEQVFASLDDLQARSKAMVSDPGSVLSIAAIPALSSRWLARTTLRFRKLHPKMLIKVVSTTPDMVTDAVLSHRAEIGLLHGPVTNKRLNATKVADNIVVAVLSKDHPLARRSSISAKDLVDQEVIGFSQEGMLHSLTTSAFQRYNKGIPATLEITTATSGIVFAQEGVGVALIDSRTAETFRFNDVVWRPFTPTISLEAQIITANDRPLPVHSLDFSNLLIHTVKSEGL